MGLCRSLVQLLTDNKSRAGTQVHFNHHPDPRTLEVNKMVLLGWVVLPYVDLCHPSCSLFPHLPVFKLYDRHSQRLQAVSCLWALAHAGPPQGSSSLSSMAATHCPQDYSVPTSSSPHSGYPFPFPGPIIGFNIGAPPLPVLIFKHLYFDSLKSF